MQSLRRAAFYFIRHGTTEWNQKQLCQGMKDIPLCKEGIDEAKALAKASTNHKIETIVTTTLLRAKETAKILHEAHPDATMHIVPELCERSWGELEGISSKEMYDIEEKEMLHPLTYTPRGGVEPRRDFAKRVERGLIKAQSCGKSPFIVSHGRVFQEVCLLLGIPPVQQVANCKIVQFTPEKNDWKADLIT